MDASNNLPISATKFDLEDSDFAAGLNNCLTKDGLSTPNAPMTWTLSSGQVLALQRGSDGTVLSVGRTSGSNNPVLSFQVLDGVGTRIVSSSIGLSFAVGTQVGMSMNTSGGVTINAPTSGIGLQVGGFTGLPAAYFTSSGVTSNAQGVVIQAGTNVSDYSLALIDSTGTIQIARFWGDGSLTLGSPTGGALGRGTLNVDTGIYVDGSILVTSASIAGTYATQAALTAAVAPLATTASVAATYHTIAAFNTAIANYYTQSQVTTLLNAKAPLASPTLTGTPAAPTPAASDNSTTIPTTAFVKNAIGTLTRSGTFTCVTGTATVTFASAFPNGADAVMVQWAYGGPNVGNVVSGSLSTTGFQYNNGNSGLCYYIATGH